MRSLVLLVSLVGFAASASGLDEIPASPLELTQIPVSSPAIASNGENYFAAWMDSRIPRRLMVYGARITPDREVLDPVGVRLLDGTAVASIASGLGHTFVLGQSLAYAIVDREARIVTRGKVADEPAANGAQVVFNGSDFVVFWADNALRTATLDPFGGVVRWPDNVVSDRAVRLHSAATDGARILVTYTHNATLYVAGTSPVGERLWADKVISEEAAWWNAVSIASAKGVFAVAWQSGESVRTIKLDANGDALAPSQVAIPWGATTRIIATGDGFRLFEQQELRVMSYALTDALAPETATPVIDLERPDSVVSFAVAEGPGGTMVVASVGRTFPNPPTAGLYAADGDSAEARVLVSRAGTTQTAPDIAIGEDGMLVAWTEHERPHIAATFFASNGTTRTIDVAANGVAPNVAAQGDAYIVAWTGITGARARVIREGALIGEEIPLVPETNAGTAAAAEGRDFIVAATQGTTGTPVRLWRIDDAGAVVAQAEIAVTPAATAGRAALACDRGECLLAWVEQTITPPCFPYKCTLAEQVLAMPLDAALVPRFSSPFVVADRQSGASNLEVGASDGAYAVVWAAAGVASMRTVSRDGQLGTTFSFSGSRPAVERDGDAWLLVREADTKLVIAHFTSDAFAGGAPLASDEQWRSAPALARKGGSIVLAYERTTIGEAAGGAVRAYVATLAAPKRRTARH